MAAVRPPATCAVGCPTTNSRPPPMDEAEGPRPAHPSEKDPAAPHPSQARGGPLQRGLGWTGREFEVTVGAVAHGGHCVARHEGRVVFVRHALPGERVVVRVTEDRHPGY